MRRPDLVRRAAWVMFSLSAVSAPAMAQSEGAAAETPVSKPAAAPVAAVSLAPVVVSAAGFEQKITEAPASITVVTREELQSRPYTSLIDALRDVEGIDVGMESTDKNGQATISMRGLPSDYTLVLINGKRQSNVGDLYPNNFGGGQFSYVPPLEAIERIEVIRGPMSTLYGSDAIGGVINIITRKITERWLGSVSTGITLQESSVYGDDKTTDVYVSGPLIANRLGLELRGGFYDRDASDPVYDPLPLPGGGTWLPTLGFGAGGRTVASESWNAGFALSFRPAENQDLVLDYSLSRQNYDNSTGQTGTLDGIDSLWRSAVVTPSGGVPIRVVQPRVGYTPEQRYDREQLSLTHTGRWSFGNTELAVTRSMTENLGRSLPLTVEERADLQDLWNDVCARRGQAAKCNNGTLANSALTPAEMDRLNAFLPRPLRTLEIDNLIVDAKLDMPIGAHVVTVGGQYLDAEMEDGTFGMFGGGFRDGTVQPHKQWALFAEDNWELPMRLTLTTGVRYDDHNRFGSQVSPRAYLVWRGTDNLTVKGGVSTGYKAPKPNQLFPGITGFGGQGVIPFVGSPDLQPETSVNTEFAVYYDNPAGYSVNATVFVNRFKDKIASGDNIANCEVAAPGERCADIGPGWADLGYTTFSQSFNIDKAETQGIELAGRVQLPLRLALRGNYTLTESEQKSGANKGKPIPSTTPAKHMLNLTLDWKATTRTKLFLTAEARADRYRDTINILGPGGAVVGTEDRFYKDYQIFHLGGSFKASDTLTFNGRINNLLDKEFLSRSGCTLNAAQDAYELCMDDYNVKDRARSYWLGATMRF